MNRQYRPLAAGAGYLLAVALYAVLAGIAPEPVTEPRPRIPSALFAVVLPGVLAFLLGSGVVGLWQRLRLRLPAAGLVVGSLAAVAAGPAEDVAWLLLLGGLGWLALLAGVELLVRTVRRWRADASLHRTEWAGAIGAAAGLGYALAFVAFAVVPAWSGGSGPGAPGAVEAVLTLAFLAGAFCLLVGLPVALALGRGLFASLLVPVLWVGYDLVTVWGVYEQGEVAVVAFTLGWPAALAAIALSTGLERLARAGWRRLR